MTLVAIKDAPLRQRLKILLALAIALAVCFIRPLTDLARLSLQSDLFSYVPLVPFIIAYLIWLRRDTVPPSWQAAWKSSGLAIAAGLMLIGAYWWERYSGWQPALEDYLAVITSSFLLLLLGAALAALGSRTLGAVAFPVALAALMIPYPVAVLARVNRFFDQASAYAACGFFSLSGTPAVKDGLQLHLPGFHIMVAPECSGIHSTLVLAITSLLAGDLYLNAAWKRALLCAFVLPLAIARNGFRIWVIGELCVHVSPAMIDSPIHHRGGPIFFLLSLIPLFLLMMFLRKFNPKRKKAVDFSDQGLSRAPLS